MLKRNDSKRVVDKWTKISELVGHWKDKIANKSKKQTKDSIQLEIQRLTWSIHSDVYISFKQVN